MLKRYDQPARQHKHVRLVKETNPLILPPTESTVYEGDARSSYYRADARRLLSVVRDVSLILGPEGLWDSLAKLAAKKILRSI